MAPAGTQTNPCMPDTDRDGLWDGTEVMSFEYVDRNANGLWDAFDRAGMDAALDDDGYRPALDNDSDGDLLCDGDITKAANIGCNGNGVAAGANWLDTQTGLVILIGEDVNPWGSLRRRGLERDQSDEPRHRR